MKRNRAKATVQLTVEGQPIEVRTGSSVATALAQRPPGVTRRSVSGQWRAPLCGMGVCHECRVLIDGRERLACQTLCKDGMQISTTDSRSAAAPATPVETVEPVVEPQR